MNVNEEELTELLPIVAELTRKYTSGESTSVSYERANQLMGTVLYCIKEYENSNKNSVVMDGSITLKEKYLYGKELVKQKVMDTKEAYNEWIVDFDFYGNRNYQETVRNAISGFFVYYDMLYEPQNHIITCDYPTLISASAIEDTGIDLISKYLNYIKIEQDFLAKLGREKVIEILKRFDDSYEKQYYNITSVVLRHLLGCILIGKNVKEQTVERDYRELQQIADNMSEYELESTCQKLLKNLIQHFYGDDVNMYEYLAHDLSEFAVLLKNVKDTNDIKNVVIL